jgi:hypothetical protein
MALAGLFATLYLLALGCASASASALVGPGQVQVISGQAPALEAVADGQIDGYSFSADVSGDECAPTVGSGSSEVSAPGGESVCVFSMSLEHFATAGTADSGQQVPGLSGTVLDAAARIPVPSGILAGSGTQVLAVDVPSGKQAVLVLSSAGFSQSFSLTERRPIGVSPAALYTTNLNPADVSFGMGQQRSVMEVDLLNGQSSVYSISVSYLQISWFMPGDPLIRPPSPEDGFLSIEFSESYMEGPNGWLLPAPLQALPPADVYIVVDGKKVEPTVTGGIGQGMLAATYVFTIPADLKRDSLVIAPGTQDAYFNNSTKPTPLRFGTAVFGAVPPNLSSDSGPSPQLAAGGAPTSPGGSANRPPTTSGSPGAGRDHLSGAMVTTVALGGSGLVLIPVPVIIVLRRRRHAEEGKRLSVEFPPPTVAAGRIPSPSAPDASAPPHAVDPPAGASAASEPPVLVVNLLGPPEVIGRSGRLNERPLEELALYLAIHAGRPISSDKLRYVLRTERKDLEPQTLRNRVAALRKAIGSDLLVRTGDGYLLQVPLECDWTSFSDLCRRGAQATGGERLTLLEQALSLVRGEPFSDVASGRYRWASEDGTASDMIVAIEEAAHELSLGHRHHGDQRAAERAARAGLRGSPGSPLLVEDLLRAASVSRARFDRAWREALAKHGDDPWLAELRDELRPGEEDVG